MTPEDLAKPEFQPLLSRFKFREIPRTAAEIQSQIKGMAQTLPYRQGEGVFGTPELKKGIAGRLKAEMSDLVKKADPELGARLARADAFHATNVDPFKADWAKRAFRLKKSGQVSKVGDIINPQMATEDIEQIIKTTGAKDAISASVLEDIISKRGVRQDLRSRSNQTR